LRSRFNLSVAVAFATVALFSACAKPAPVAAPSAALYDPSNLPSGPLADSIRLGHDIMDAPAKYLPKNVGADITCSACHIAAGTVARGGSFVGTYARFPQWNRRAKRVIALQDRLAECFLYSMNGTPPAYTSKEMVAMTAYIAYMSRGVATGAPVDKSTSFIVALPSASPDVAHGAAIYAKSCQACHQANGAGIHGTFPPLWGPTSFNTGAGMEHLDRMTGFVMYNMPKGAAGTLSLHDAYDVSAWVLTHARPKFNRNRVIDQQALRADYF
jgi:thiosulfate dehydrogenase